MSLDPRTLAAILAMAAATYLCRAGGYWLFRQVQPTPFVRGVLFYLPGTLFVAFVLPGLATGGTPQWVGAAATLGAMLVLHSVGWSILAGTGACWVVWWWLT